MTGHALLDSTKHHLGLVLPSAPSTPPPLPHKEQIAWCQPFLQISEKAQCHTKCTNHSFDRSNPQRIHWMLPGGCLLIHFRGSLLYYCCLLHWMVIIQAVPVIAVVHINVHTYTILLSLVCLWALWSLVISTPNQLEPPHCIFCEIRWPNIIKSGKIKQQSTK